MLLELSRSHLFWDRKSQILFFLDNFTYKTINALPICTSDLNMCSNGLQIVTLYTALLSITAVGKANVPFNVLFLEE